MAATMTMYDSAQVRLSVAPVVYPKPCKAMYESAPTRSWVARRLPSRMRERMREWFTDDLYREIAVG